MPTPHPLARWSAVVLVAASLLAGCGSDRTAPGSGAEPVKFPPIETEQEGARRARPERWSSSSGPDLRDGLLPLALNAHAPDVVERVGRETFIGGLNVARDITTPLAPSILRTEPVEAVKDKDGGRPELALVYAEGRGSQSAKLKHVPCCAGRRPDGGSSTTR